MHRLYRSKLACTAFVSAGPTALPKGSEVVLFNTHAPGEVLERVVRLSSTHNVTFLHIRGNPLDQQELKDKLDLSK